MNWKLLLVFGIALLAGLVAVFWLSEHQPERMAPTPTPHAVPGAER